MLPPFFAGTFNTTILENTPVGEAITTVTAQDNDPKVKNIFYFSYEEEEKKRCSILK